MILYNGTNNKINPVDGLKVEDGTAYQPYLSKTENADDVVDFSNADNVLKYYPQNAGVAGSTETLSIETIGAKTAVKIAGSTTYSGTMTWGGFTDSLPYVLSLLMRAKKIDVNGNNIPAFLFGNGNLKIDTKNAISQAITYKLNDTDIDIVQDYNCDVIKIKSDNITEDIVLLNNTVNKQGFISIADSVIKPISVDTDLDIKTNLYFKDNMPSFNSLKIDVKDVCTLTTTNKKLTKSGDQDVTAGDMQIYNGYVLIDLTGGDLSSVSAVDVQSETTFTAKLINNGSKKTIYLSYDVNAKKDLNVNALVINLTGTDVVLKNPAKISFTDTMVKTMKVKQININKGSTGEALIWTDTDTVVLPKVCTWFNFKELFDNYPNTQTLAPYLSDDCELNIDLQSKELKCDGTIALYFTGNEDIQNKYGKYCYIFEPETQEAITFNMLLQNTAVKVDNPKKGLHYIGCEAKSLSFNFANKGLTQITSNITALTREDSLINSNDIKVAKTENRSSALVQSSNEPTKVYINCLETKSIADATFNFEWTKEDSYNIEVEKFIKDNAKYNWNFGGNAMYNDVSRDFMERFNKGENMSVILQAQRTLNSKINQLFICSLKTTGVISDPTIQVGDLTIALSEITGDEVRDSITNYNSNFIMMFSDDELLASELN